MKDKLNNKVAVLHSVQLKCCAAVANTKDLLQVLEDIFDVFEEYYDERQAHKIHNILTTQINNGLLEELQWITRQRD